MTAPVSLFDFEPVAGATHALGYWQARDRRVPAPQRWERALAVARGFGFRVSMTYARPRYCFEASSDPGVTADVRLVADDPDYSPAGALLHEVGHHQCAPYHRRYAPEHGLGTFGDMTVRSPEMRVSRATRESEEMLATVMAAAWGAYTGALGFRETLQRVERWSLPKVRAALDHLKRWGLLDAAGRPVLGFRPGPGTERTFAARVQAHGDTHCVAGGGAMWRVGHELVQLRRGGDAVSVEARIAGTRLWMPWPVLVSQWGLAERRPYPAWPDGRLARA